jgi:hypothetical protein
MGKTKAGTTKNTESHDEPKEKAGTTKNTKSHEKEEEC